MSNRRSKRQTRKITFRTEIHRLLPHGSKLKLRRLELLRLRRHNLAQASRHLTELARRYDSGKQLDRRTGKEIFHVKSPDRAAALRKSLAATLQLAESLPRLP